MVEWIVGDGSLSMENASSYNDHRICHQCTCHCHSQPPYHESMDIPQHVQGNDFTTDSEMWFSDGATEIGTKLFERIILAASSRAPNIVLSPTAVALGLIIMCCNLPNNSIGHAVAKTLAQTLGNNEELPPNVANGFASDFLMSLPQTVLVRCRLLIDKPPATDFLINSEKYFPGLCHTTSPFERQHISEWLHREFNGALLPIRSIPMIDKSNSLIIATHIQSLWKFQFPPQATIRHPFVSELDNENPRKISLVNGNYCLLMQQCNHFLYYRSSLFSAVKLPCLDGSLSVVLVLPAEGFSLAQVSSEISTATAWLDVLSSMRSCCVHVGLPRLHIDTEAEMLGSDESPLEFRWLTQQGVPGITANENASFFSSILTISSIEFAEGGIGQKTNGRFQSEVSVASMGRGTQERILCTRPFLAAIIADSGNDAIISIASISNPIYRESINDPPINIKCGMKTTVGKGIPLNSRSISRTFRRQNELSLESPFFHEDIDTTTIVQADSYRDKVLRQDLKHAHRYNNKHLSPSIENHEMREIWSLNEDKVGRDSGRVPLRPSLSVAQQQQQHGIMYTSLPTIPCHKTTMNSTFQHGSPQEKYVNYNYDWASSPTHHQSYHNNGVPIRPSQYQSNYVYEPVPPQQRQWELMRADPRYVRHQCRSSNPMSVSFRLPDQQDCQQAYSPCHTNEPGKHGDWGTKQIQRPRTPHPRSRATNMETQPEGLRSPFI